jgi:DNA modification methylase
MSGPLKSETDMLRTLARGTYTLAALYAHVEENADVARDDGHSPSAPGHSWDPRWRHRVRGWLANQRRAGRARRITHAVWALEGTPENPRRMLLITAGAGDPQIELQCRDAVALLGDVDGPLDAVITDPPWGLEWDRPGSRSQYAREEAKVLDGYIDVPAREYLAFSRRWIAAAARVLRPGGQLVVVTGPQRAAPVQIAAEEHGLAWVCTIVARREFVAPSRRRPSPAHWAITAMCRGPVSHRRRVFNAPGDQRRSHTGGLYPTDLWLEGNGRADRPGLLRYTTELPEPLARRIVTTFTDEGEHVCDPLLGGGSIQRACWQTGRRFTGGDLNPTAVMYAAARLLAEHAWPQERQPQLPLAA